MLIKKFFILFCCTSIIGCTTEPNVAENPKDDLLVVKTKTSGIVYKPSELAIVMRKMYENMSVVGELIDHGEEVPDSLLIGYEKMLSAKATKPEEINEQFYGFANIWLSDLKGLKDTKDINNYNNVMNACVNCHQSFCPGPISKIKKLKLVP